MYERRISFTRCVSRQFSKHFFASDQYHLTELTRVNPRLSGFEPHIYGSGGAASVTVDTVLCRRQACALGKMCKWGARHRDPRTNHISGSELLSIIASPSTSNPATQVSEGSHVLTRTLSKPRPTNLADAIFGAYAGLLRYLSRH